jgi:chromosome segregation ATPase
MRWLKMTTRKPAASTQIKALQAQVAELEKKLKSSEDMKLHYSKQATEADAQIEQVHAFLDVLPGAAGRKTEHEESWERKPIGVMTRLASYLAYRGAA